ncbi:nucleotidyltransferase family protein [Alteromonas halophila]|uniref:MobA-like NTP transferase domain-containing protein n=1 Tax=Alteromonas halophila TaxID=516698 RepID=A0A918JRC9_9ALTE|nr:nucleotidyltransferase family protein [Alteromonas halophila]GGW95716.1 hypothetical protein GCM10007391_32340 [Alteromonas halophila]
MTPRALVLAGGAGSRYTTGNKLLSKRADGTLLLAHVIKALTPLVNDTLVVTGKWHEELQGILNSLPVRVSYNGHWQGGMGFSLAHGIKEITQAWPDTSHVLVCVGDLPAISTASVQPLLDAARRSPGMIIASRWHNAEGVPAVFPESCFAELRSLRGDSGAGRIIKRTLALSPPQCRAVPHAEAGWDIDTEDDWQRTPSSLP